MRWTPVTASQDPDTHKAPTLLKHILKRQNTMTYEECTVSKLKVVPGNY